MVVMFSFHSVLIPLVVMIPIEVAIFLNMAIPYIQGVDMVYMGYIIVSSIQLGATVDYSYTKDVGKKCYFRWMEMAWSVGWNVLSGRFREL